MDWLKPGATVDHIIVGAGSAGCVLAARLSENPANRVMLLEAGPDFRSSERPPEMSGLNFREIIGRGGYHWPALLARFSREQSPSILLRGLGAGGSSSIHALTAVRGIPADFDSWASQGCDGWAWNDVLHDLIRLENDLDYGLQPYHGTTGPIPIVRTPRPELGGLARAFVESATALGHPWCDDINAPDARGVYAAPVTIRNGQRVSASDAYLEPARDRHNLTVLGNALVDRVELQGGQTIGVRVRRSGETVAFESGSVILCAGAIHSPAVLMRSGIGPADRLRAVGVEPCVDLPGVGQNLCDHPLIRLKLGLSPNVRAASIRILPNDCGLRTDSQSAGDITIFVSNVGASVAEGGIGVAMMQPRSRGSLSLSSADPLAGPVVEFNLLSDGWDLVGLRAGIDQALHMLGHRSLASVIESISLADRSVEDAIRGDSIDNWLRAHCEGFFHAAGTCRMGSPDDPRSVVAPDGRVIAVDGLRVADASIMPDPPRAATYLTTLMIAEHLSRRINARC